MSKTSEKLLKLANHYTKQDGFNTLPVTDAYCIKVSSTELCAKQKWQASIGIVFSGCKEIQLEGKPLLLAEGDYVLTLFDFPVNSRISKVTKVSPYLSLVVKLDFEIFCEVIKMVDVQQHEENESAVALTSGKATEEMNIAALRLLEVCKNKEDAKALGPALIRELLYYTLKTPECHYLRKFLFGARTISEVVASISEDLTKEIDSDAICKKLGVSRAVFYRQFKQLTRMSPIQYQKRLRLLEARRLMLSFGETADRASLKVGFNSPSQFSREFSRMFGSPPKKEVQGAQKTSRG